MLVIGAGIVGARVAYEAARAGLAVALVDRGDVGGGSSAASSKLVHGGLRYLATGDVRLVRALNAERQLLGSRIAPHLVRPLPLVLAVERGRRAAAAQLPLALAAYGAASGLSRPLPRLVGRDTARSLVPALEPRATLACGVVQEAVTHDARLALATARAAERAGAVVLNYAQVAALHPAAGRVRAADVRDVIGGETATVRCNAVVNAAGPWVDGVRRLAAADARPLVRLSKGVHAVVPLDKPWGAGLALFDRLRSAIAVPWQGLLLVGVTDDPYDGGPAVGVLEEEVETVLGWFDAVLPDAGLRPARVKYAFAGLRVLPRGGADTRRARRRHIVEAAGGMVSVAGGKLTTHRRIALDALAALPIDVRPRPLLSPGPPLPGADLGAAVETVRRCLDGPSAAHLVSLYGGEAVDVVRYADLGPGALERIHPSGPDVWAQVRFAVDHEFAVTADDVLARRTTVAVRGLAGPAVAGAVAAALTPTASEARPRADVATGA